MLNSLKWFGAKGRTIALAIMIVVATCLPSIAQYNIDYFLWIGRQELIKNHYHDAIRTLNSLLRADDRAYEGYFLRGIAKYNLDDMIGADADFSRAIELNPVYTNAFTYRAITRSRLGNYNDALGDFREAIELRPDLPAPYFSLGVTRLLNGQFEEAIKDFDRFILYEKRVSDAYLNRGICYLNLKDTVSAYADFDRAVRTNRYDTRNYNQRGVLYMAQERYDEAESDFNHAIVNDTCDILSYFNRSLLYNNTKRPVLSLEDLDRVIKLDSTNSISYFNRAIVRSQIGDYNRALEDYDRVASSLPENVLVHFYRANLLTQLGEIERAEGDYSRAIELYPDFANAYINRSHVRYMLGNSQEAKRDRAIADRKLEAHRSRLVDSAYSIYSDTTYRFDRLLSFDTKLAGSSFNRINNNSSTRDELIPLYKFNIGVVDSISSDGRAGRYYAARINSFMSSFDGDNFSISHRQSALSTDSLTSIERELADRARSEEQSWQLHFKRGVAQSLIRQYTASINSLTEAIKLNPSNPFLYFERATVQSEMIDFISSIDNQYQQITIDSDPANRLTSQSSRSYNYDQAIEDLNQAARLYPDMAYIYYNRANLLARSGRLPEAYQDYTNAITLYPTFAEGFYNRGVVQIMMNDASKGILDISKAGELGVERAYELLRDYNDMR